MIVYLGEKDGFPIYTFTSDANFNVPYNRPSNEYLKMIISGMKKTLQLSNNEITMYFLSKRGVKGNYTEAEIRALL